MLLSNISAEIKLGSQEIPVAIATKHIQIIFLKCYILLNIRIAPIAKQKKPSNYDFKVWQLMSYSCVKLNFTSSLLLAAQVGCVCNSLFQDLSPSLDKEGSGC